MIEYVIWGIPPNEKEEILLLEKPQGETIKSIEHAQKFKLWCENKGATNVRIQKIDLTENNILNLFTGAIQ